MFAVVGMIMKSRPSAHLARWRSRSARYGPSSSAISSHLILTFYVTSLLFVLVVLGDRFARLRVSRSWRFVRYIREELLIVLGTSSSERVLPG